MAIFELGLPPAVMVRLEVRPMRREDFEPLLGFCDAMHRESPAYRDMGLDHDKLMRLGEAIIAQPDRMCGFVAVDGEELVGVFAGCLTEPYFGPGLMACDLALFVPPDRRGGWAAVKLVRAYEVWARERGAQTAQLGITTGVRQQETAALYRRMGFQEIGLVCRKTLD